MEIVYSLTSKLRGKLKQPLGTLIRGSFGETTNRLKDMIAEEKPPCMVSVGDTVSRNLEKSGIPLHLSIIDNLVMRGTAEPFPLTADQTIHVKNPPSTITDEAIQAIHDSLETNSRTEIVVEGEEDLLTLIAVMYAPEESLVVYGQPYEGIVVVRATATKKAEIATILQSMENARKAK